MLKPVRVLHLSAGNGYGGIETLLLTLAKCRNLCPRMEPSFALCFEGRISSELRDAGAEVTILGAVRARRIDSITRARKALTALLCRQEFSFVICHGPWVHALLGPAVRRKSIPLAFWGHGIVSKRNWTEWLAGRTRPDLAIANSRVTSESMRRLFPYLHAHTVYLPVVPVAVHPSERAAARAEMNTPGDVPVIIQVSRIEKGKGHLTLLRALASLRGLPFHCWIVGGPQTQDQKQYFELLRQSAASLQLEDRVLFLGERNDVPRLLHAADIVCQPNDSPDAFGITFIEGLLAGRPVVTSAVGGALEIIRPDCGVLVQPGDVNGFSSALRELIRDPGLRESLGQAGPARAREVSDPARQLRALYETLAGAASIRSPASAIQNQAAS